MAGKWKREKKVLNVANNQQKIKKVQRTYNFSLILLIICVLINLGLIFANTQRYNELKAYVDVYSKLANIRTDATDSSCNVYKKIIADVSEYTCYTNDLGHTTGVSVGEATTVLCIDGNVEIKMDECTSTVSDPISEPELVPRCDEIIDGRCVIDTAKAVGI